MYEVGLITGDAVAPTPIVADSVVHTLGLLAWMHTAYSHRIARRSGRTSSFSSLHITCVRVCHVQRSDDLDEVCYLPSDKTHRLHGKPFACVITQTRQQTEFGVFVAPRTTAGTYFEPNARDSTHNIYVVRWLHIFVITETVLRDTLPG